MRSARLLHLSPLRITAVYLVFGLLWIGTTDWLVVQLFDTPDAITLAQTMKGWLFVGLSAALILGLTTMRQRQIDDSSHRLRRVTEQLQVLQRVFRHNNRNDMNVVQGYIALVLADLTDDEHGQKLTTAHDTASNIAATSQKMQIINQLDIENAITTHEIDLVPLVRSAVTDVEAANPEVDASVDLLEEAWIRGNDSIEHAIPEVLENAVVHHPADQSCKIDVSIERERDAVSLVIEDNGEPIPETEITALRAQT